jgi:hypothetical protein
MEREREREREREKEHVCVFILIFHFNGLFLRLDTYRHVASLFGYSFNPSEQSSSVFP